MKIDNIERVGNNIKKARKRKGLTISELSLYTGLSVGYLSNVERNQTSPTLRNLNLICNSIGISILDLISIDTEEKLIIRKKDTISREYPEFKMQSDIIDFGSENGIYMYITIEPGKTKTISNFMHPYSEVCTVLEGKLTIELENEIYILEEGDTIYLKKHSRHIMKNSTDKKCVSFWHRERATAYL